MRGFFQEALPVEDPVLGGEDDAVPGAVIAIQSFSDFLGYNPHLHILSSGACFYGNGMFRVAPSFETKGLEEVFRYKVFKMLLAMAALCLIGLIATIIFLPEVVESMTSEKQSMAFTGLKESNMLKGAFAFRIATDFSMACIVTFLPLFASQNLGLRVSLIGLPIASRTPLALLPSSAGTIADRYNRRILVIADSIAAIISTASMPMSLRRGGSLVWGPAWQCL